MEKKNNIVTIILVILIIVALVGGYFIGKSNLFEKKNNKPNDNNSNLNQVIDELQAKKFEYYDMYENKVMYDIYDISANENTYMIIGYNNKTYMIYANSMTGIFDCNYKLVNNEVKWNNNYLIEYKIKDNKLYMNYDNVDILVSNNIVDKIIYQTNLGVYYIVNDTLYYYDPDHLETRILQYSEWQFNKNINIIIY